MITSLHSFDGVQYKVSIWGCISLTTLSPQEKKVIYDKIKKIISNTGEWGTTSLNNKPVTIRVKKEGK